MSTRLPVETSSFFFIYHIYQIIIIATFMFTTNILAPLELPYLVLRICLGSLWAFNTYLLINFGKATGITRMYLHLFNFWIIPLSAVGVVVVVVDDDAAAFGFFLFLLFLHLYQYDFNTCIVSLLNYTRERNASKIK